ncbi:MAG: hypothetical protein ACPGSC_00415 [Granulosicoccaceae bacterium]
MKALTKISALAFMLAFFSSAPFAGTASGLVDDKRVIEVYVLSLQFLGQGRASLVAKPCDSYSPCDKLVARMDRNTVWQDEGLEISYADARNLDWQSAVITVDEWNNTQLISRMLTGDEQ